MHVFMKMITIGGSTAFRSLLRSPWPFVPLAVGYGLLLANSWSPDTLSIMMPGSLQEGLKGEGGD